MLPLPPCHQPVLPHFTLQQGKQVQSHPILTEMEFEFTDQSMCGPHV